MFKNDSHYIPEQNKPYQRGIVLGLTMAEVGILIIFILLLLIGYNIKAMQGSKIVKVEKLQTMEETLAKQLTQQSHQLANKEGQLQRYEKMLVEAGLGKGERPCWVKPDGTIEYLYDIILASDGIRMREYQYEHRSNERSRLQMPAVNPTEALNTEEYLRITKPLYDNSVADNCRFFVAIYDDTGPTEKELYKELLRTVENHFYKRLDLGRAPF